MIRAARLRGLPPTTIAAALFISALLGVPSAYAGVTTIAWDPSPDPSVVGYRVHVGTEPGNYTETFDVGNTLTFSYDGIDGRIYYIAVAAYSPGPLVGPLSNEVSTARPGDITSYWSSLWSQVTAASHGRPAGRSTAGTVSQCWGPEYVECVQVRQLAHVAGPVSSLAATPDGRLLFVEDERRLRLITSTGLAVQSLIDTRISSTRLKQVAVDPRFLETGFVWATETRKARGGTRTHTVVRYRLVGHRLAERTVIVAGITLPAVGDAVLGVDSSHIYLAIPGSADAYHPHWGMLLRFNSDGSIPDDSVSGSAVLDVGHELPSAIATEPSGNRIWLSGGKVSYPALFALPHEDHYDLLKARNDGLLERTCAAHEDPAQPLFFDPSGLGQPLAVAAGPSGQIFVSFHTSATLRPTAIIELHPTQTR